VFIKHANDQLTKSLQANTHTHTHTQNMQTAK